MITASLDIKIFLEILMESNQAIEPNWNTDLYSMHGGSFILLERARKIVV